jgi:hypothetical protein
MSDKKQPDAAPPADSAHLSSSFTARAQNSTLPSSPPIDVPPDLPIIESGNPEQESAKQEFLWHAHSYLNEYIRFGDAKAGFAGTLASGLFAALYGSGVYARAVQTSLGAWRADTWLGIAATPFLAFGVFLALWAVRPRLRSTQAKGFIFWGSIAAHPDLSSFQRSFESQSVHALNDHLLHHLYDLSKRVCIPKYRNVSLCIAMLGVGAVFAAASLALQSTEASSTPLQPRQQRISVLNGCRKRRGTPHFISTIEVNIYPA